MTYIEFCLWTSMDDEDVVTPMAYNDFINQSQAICDWWAEYQGRYV